jgi:hypothetical protein
MISNSLPLMRVSLTSSGRPAGRTAREAHDSLQGDPCGQPEPVGLCWRWRPGSDGLGPSDRAETGFFHPVIDAAVAGVVCCEDGQSAARAAAM